MQLFGAPYPRDADTRIQLLEKVSDPFSGLDDEFDSSLGLEHEPFRRLQVERVAVDIEPLRVAALKPLGSIRIACGREARGRFHQTGEHRRLREGEVAGVHAEVLLCRGLDAVGALAEVHDVQVPGEDLVLRVGLLESQRQARLPQLATYGLLVRGRAALLSLGSSQAV